MDLHHYRPNRVFIYFKKLAKIILPYKIYNSLRKFSIELLWTFAYYNKSRRYKNSSIYMSTFKNLSGLEIGGPSWVWLTIIPIYQSIKNLDNIITPSTKNENEFLKKHKSIRYQKGQMIDATKGWIKAKEGSNQFNWFLLKKGDLIFQDATDLDIIEKENYDFVVCSNVLEHIANPLKALHEFKRVTKKMGYISIVVPDKRYTFDYKRPVTKLDHIRDDFINSVGEDDMTHLEEVLKLTDEESTIHNAHPNQNFNKVEFEAYCRDNFNNRGMHHHVFDLELLTSLAKEVDLKIIDVNYFSTPGGWQSIVLLTQKT